MNLKKCNQLLQEYKNQLNVISVNDTDYKISLGITVSNFFNEMKKLDINFLEHYFNHINEENITKNKVQKDALHYLILLIIKNTNNAEFFSKFFPEYLESASIAKSSWRFVRWLQILISWIIKPKLKLNGLPEAVKILNALRNIKHRLASTKDDLIDVNLEMESYKSLTFIVEKFLENKVPLLIYISINEDKLLEEWGSSYKKKLYIGNASDLSKECADSDSLLKYLKHRIRLLLDSDGKTKLLNECIKLQDFVFKKEFSLFEEKICEIKEFIQNKSLHKNAVKIQGIYNLIEGIKQRLKLMSGFNDEGVLNENINQLTHNFKQILNLTVDKIQFYYEAYKKNLDEQADLCYGNSPNFYEILNKLESILYIDKNLFFYSSNQAFSNTDFATLEGLQMLAKKLENCAKGMDPKSLENDLRKLSQFILTEVLFLQTELKNEIEEYNERYTSYSEGWDTDWDDSSSYTSETPNMDELEQEDDLNRDEVFITNIDSQSDSGISDDESNQRPIATTLFFNRPAEQLTRHCEREARGNPMDDHVYHSLTMTG
jgi:hypothetical protein